MKDAITLRFGKHSIWLFHELGLYNEPKLMSAAMIFYNQCYDFRLFCKAHNLMRIDYKCLDYPFN